MRVVDDLRTGYERAIAPDRLPAGATGHAYDVIGQAPPLILAGALFGGEGMYRAFITAPGANEAFAAVLRDIIAADYVREGLGLTGTEVAALRAALLS